MKKIKRGFTLIELLVVISIIGILTSLALVSYSGAQKQTRDTQRRSDLQQVRNALEAYAASNGGRYPDDGVFDQCNSLQNLCDSPGFSPFISASACPTDPLGGTRSYRYCTDGSGGVGTPGPTEYGLYTNNTTTTAPGLETGGWWVVCSDGRVGKVNTWAEIWTFCPTS